MYTKLFIPGPTHVRDRILRAQAVPMLSHRSWEYSRLQLDVTSKLQQLLYTAQRVYLYSSSSTGVLNPVHDIAALIREKYPDVLILVDAVSCMAGARIEFDAWGLDVCFAGTQKCFALPPGLTVCAVSSRARQRAAQVAHPGFYFAYAQMDRRYEQGQTPVTPPVSLIQALDVL